MTIQVVLTTETKQVTNIESIGQPYFGVQLITQRDLTSGNIIYSFTEQEMNELCEAIKFVRTRGNTEEVLTDEFEADVQD